MRVLTVMQPWASFLVWGEKLYETRTWRSSQYGALAIHASAAINPEARRLCETPAFREVLAAHHITDPKQLPTGAIVGTVNILGYFPTDAFRDEEELTAREIAFGDWSDGKWAWQLSHPRELPTPIPCKGQLSIWHTDLL